MSSAPAIAPVIIGQAVPTIAASTGPAVGEDAFGQVLRSAQDAVAGVEGGPVQVVLPAGPPRQAEATDRSRPQLVASDVVAAKPTPARKTDKASANQPGLGDGDPFVPVAAPTLPLESALPAFVGGGTTSPATSNAAESAAVTANGQNAPAPIAWTDHEVADPKPALAPSQPDARVNPATPADTASVEPIARQSLSADPRPARYATALATPADGVPAPLGTGLPTAEHPAADNAQPSVHNGLGGVTAGEPRPDAAGLGQGLPRDVLSSVDAAVAPVTKPAEIRPVETGPARRNRNQVADPSVTLPPEPDVVIPPDAISVPTGIARAMGRAASAPVDAPSASAFPTDFEPARVEDGAPPLPSAGATDAESQSATASGDAIARTPARPPGPDIRPVFFASPDLSAAAPPSPALDPSAASELPAPSPTQTPERQSPEPFGLAVVRSVDPTARPAEVPKTGLPHDITAPTAVGPDDAPQPVPTQVRPAVTADPIAPVHAGTAPPVSKPVGEPATHDTSRVTADRKNESRSASEPANLNTRQAEDPSLQATGSPDVAPGSPTATTVPVAAPAAASHAPTITAQIGPALVTLAKTVNGVEQMTVRLHPAELGMVQVRIERAPSGLTQIDITADKPETLLALQRDQPALHRTLDQAGVPSTGRTVSFHAAVESAPASPSGGTTASGHGSSHHSATGRSQYGGPDSDGSSGGGRGGYFARETGRWPAGRPGVATPSDGHAAPMVQRTYRTGLDITA